MPRYPHWPPSPPPDRPLSPYDPADAIFTAAAMLCANGARGGSPAGLQNAVFAYNHSQAYVQSVLLRARLLGGTPDELLGAITLQKPRNEAVSATEDKLRSALEKVVILLRARTGHDFSQYKKSTVLRRPILERLRASHFSVSLRPAPCR